MVIWTSLGQDGSWEGVYGQVLTANGQHVGNEFLVNTSTPSRQIFPAVAGDGAGRFLTAWSSFVGGNGSFELLAQRFATAQGISKPAAPFVSGLNSSRLSITWPALDGYDVAFYELYIDNSTAPVTVTNSIRYTLTGLAPSSTHSARLLYQLSDGRRSPTSDPGTGNTWGEDLNGNGLPDDWQALYWGNNPKNWPPGNVDSDGDGMTNFEEFLAGTNPLDPSSALRIGLSSTSQGWRLDWNTHPGFIYQVQVAADVNVWTDFGAPRFAAGTTDSLAVDGAHGVSYYRVTCLR
jgi:hypothetical protein